MMQFEGWKEGRIFWYSEGTWEKVSHFEAQEIVWFKRQNGVFTFGE